jgi:small-conductance mechanosensitive channel
MHNGFWDTYGDPIVAAVAVLASVLLAFAVDRFLLRRAERAAMRMDTTVFSREARTRLRWVRRAVFVLIILIGLAIALEQMTSIRRITTGLLASTAFLGLIVGFAGQTVIANFVAGMLLAITQPARIGDYVTVHTGEKETTGTVVDIALTYTQFDTGNGDLVVVPNTSLATGRVVNHTAGDRREPITISLGLPPDTDIGAVRSSIDGIEGSKVILLSLRVDQAEIEVSAPSNDARDRIRAEGELREQVQDALRTAGLLEHQTGVNES